MNPVVHRLHERLKAAQARHGREALARLEPVFWRIAGYAKGERSPNPLQQPTHYFRGLSAAPWPDPSLLAAIAILERHADEIRAELAQADEARSDFDDGTPHSGDWQAIHLRYGARPVERTRALCPFTVELVNTLPRIGEMAMVSRLAPGAHIRPHCGVTNTRYTAHLGLHVPEGCWFRVADEVRPWREGACLLFDDSFEHEAANPTDDYREVLLVDFWHPELTDPEVELLDEVAALLASLRSRVQM